MNILKTDAKVCFFLLICCTLQFRYKRKATSFLMEYTDTYKTIGSSSEGLYKEKGSKFIAYAFPVSNEQHIREIIASLKKEHHSARHHCFAWRLGTEDQTFRLNDDGEPSGSAGRPILGQIQQRELTDILIVVVRYFGGILLGTSGLANAYKLAASDALTKVEIVEKIVRTAVVINFDYRVMNDVMMVLKEFQLDISESHFDLKCQIKMMVRKQLLTVVMEKLGKIGQLETSIITHE